MPSQQVIPKARQAAERAIELNPARVEPYSVLAFITTFYDWNWSEAKKQFEKAIEINPAYSPAHYWYSNYLSWREGDYLHSADEGFKAIELEPLLSHSHNILANVYICFGKFEEARKSCQTAIELDASSFLAYCALSIALHGLDEIGEAIETIKFTVSISARHPYALHLLGWLYAMTDNTDEAQKILDELITRSKTEFISGLSLSVAAYSSKKYDEAFEFLEQAFEERASLLVSINGYPFLSFIKTDPRFQPFLKRMNYPPKKTQLVIES